jgi:hypothetical protein
VSSPSIEDARRRLGEIAERAVQWREMIRKPHPIEPGSSLDTDDQVFPALPASHLIWHGISHAVDHLDAYLHPIVTSGISFPLAPQTLARSGVLGAAHALWILDAPVPVDRQLRALRMAHEELRNECNAYEGLASSTESIAELEGLTSTVAARRRRMAEAAEAGEAIGKTVAQVRKKPTETMLIDEVIERYQQAHPAVDQAKLLNMYRLIWRMHSGISHGFMWPVMHRTDFTNAAFDSPDRSGHGGLVTNTEVQLAISAVAMSLLISDAFRLFNERRIAS